MALPHLIGGFPLLLNYSSLYSLPDPLRGVLWDNTKYFFPSCRRPRLSLLIPPNVHPHWCVLLSLNFELPCLLCWPLDMREYSGFQRMQNMFNSYWRRGLETVLLRLWIVKWSWHLSSLSRFPFLNGYTKPPLHEHIFCDLIQSVMPSPALLKICLQCCSSFRTGSINQLVLISEFLRFLYRNLFRVAR